MLHSTLPFLHFLFEGFRAELGLGIVCASWNPFQPEITDLIVEHDSRTLGRMEVRKQDVLETFFAILQSAGDARG